MDLVQQIADELAQKALAIMNRTGSEDILKQVATAVGASSSTMEEAFLTAVRVRRAEARAIEVLARFEAAPDGPATTRS